MGSVSSWVPPATAGRWLYWGCYQRTGHGLFLPGMESTFNSHFFKYDGVLAPVDSDAGYQALVTRLPAYKRTALGFWDYTVDQRRGSNSTFYAPSLTISPEDLLAEARRQFPEVWARLPEVTLLPGVNAGPPP